MPAALFGDILRRRAPAVGDEVLDDVEVIVFEAVGDVPDEDEVLLVFEFGRRDELEAGNAKIDRRCRYLLLQLGDRSRVRCSAVCENRNP